MKTSDGVRIARTRAYERQKELRDRLHTRVDEALDVSSAKAYAAWRAKEVEADRFVKWLRDQRPPPDCAAVVNWLTGNPALAFAAYNPYLDRVAREVTVAVAGELDAGVSAIAGELVDELKEA